MIDLDEIEAQGMASHRQVRALIAELREVRAVRDAAAAYMDARYMHREWLWRGQPFDGTDRCEKALATTVDALARALGRT